MPPNPVIRAMLPGDVLEVRLLGRRAWRDTYVHPEGVSAEWVEDYWRPRLSPQALQAYARRLGRSGDGAEPIDLVAMEGTVLTGWASASRPDEGDQCVDALYVDGRARSRGIGTALLTALLQGLDPDRPTVLSVAAFNEGAIRFYARNGFTVIAGSRELYAGAIEVISMRRPARGLPGHADPAAPVLDDSVRGHNPPAPRR